MPPRKRFALIVLTLVATVGCDQQTKSFATANLRGFAARSYFADTLRFDYAENAGGFLGLGESLPGQGRTALLTYGCTAGIAALLVYVFLAARWSALQVLALSLICGGGIGNVLDRWTCGGYVRDFLNVGIDPIRTGIFNVADAAMMAGCVLTLITSWTRRAPPKS
jgi:signal peptidase II